MMKIVDTDIPMLLINFVLHEQKEGLKIRFLEIIFLKSQLLFKIKQFIISKSYKRQISKQKDV